MTNFYGKYVGNSAGGSSGGSGITSINGDTSPAQTIAGGIGITVSTVSGTTTITATGGGGGITALTGDVTASGSGSVAATLAATTNATLTTLSGLTTAGSLATVGTITTGTWSGTTITVGHGGTGTTALTAGNVVLGNGASPVNFVAPGTSGNVLTSNGSTWTSLAPSGGGISGAGFTGHLTKWSGTSSVTSSNWEENATTSALSNQGGDFGSATLPLIDLTTGAGTGAGLYTNSSGDLFLTAEGANVLHGDGTNLFLDAAGAGGVYFAASRANSASFIDATTGSNGSFNLFSGGSSFNLLMTSNQQNVLNGFGSTTLGSYGVVFPQNIGYNIGTHTGTTYAVSVNDTIVNMTNTAARTATLPLISAMQFTVGQTYVVHDGAGTGLTAPITVSANTGQTIDGASSYSIQINGGSATFTVQSATNFIVSAH